jgi:hypothetical protein
MKSKKLIIISIIFVAILITGVILWKNGFFEHSAKKIPTPVSNSAFNAPNIYNPNDGTLLKPGETVQIKGTNTYVTQGKIGIWSK